MQRFICFSISCAFLNVDSFKSEIKEIKSTYVTVEQLEDIKKELCNFKNNSPPFSAAKINIKRGTYRDSGPIGLSHFDESTVNSSEGKPSCEPSTDKEYSLKNIKINEKQSEGSSKKLSDATFQQTPGSVTDCRRDDANRDESQPIVSDRNRLSRNHQSAGFGTTDNESYAQVILKSNNEWTVVQRKGKKSKNRVEGKSGIAVVEPDEMFRAAE
ncbi:unnamed protein product [Parnassius apollo]|uniref:(apollo) hypothetical protein n=1 Tax=Parnassius apollo TaxID=110799 RepID=A0A8S3YAD3_PARAO|nr:unnamed protein product [Parnassius apollo]